MKIKYYVLELLFIIFVVNGYGIYFDMDKADLVCLTEGINNYLEFGWNNYFHWYRNDMHTVCRFETARHFYLSWFVITYYALLKYFGAKKFPQACSPHFILSELCVYVLSFVVRIFLFTQASITSASLINAIIGVTLFFLPLICFALLIIARKHIFYHTKLKQFWIKHQRPCELSVLIFSSLLIFPMLYTILFGIVAVIFGFKYVYSILPNMLWNYCFNAKKPPKTLLPPKHKDMLNFITFSAVWFEFILALNIYNQFPSWLWFICQYLPFIILVRGVIYSLIFHIKASAFQIKIMPLKIYYGVCSLYVILIVLSLYTFIMLIQKLFMN